MSSNLRDQLQTTLSGTHTLERELGGGGIGVGNCIGYVPWCLTGPGEEHTIRVRVERSELEMRLHKETVGSAGNTENPRHLRIIMARSHAGA